MNSQNEEPATASSTGPKRAAARPPEKKAREDGDAKGSVPAQTAATATPVLPFSLDFGILTGNDPANGDGIDSAGATPAVSAGTDTKDQATQATTDVTQTSPPPVSGDLAFALKLDSPGTPDAKDAADAKDVTQANHEPAPNGAAATIERDARTSADATAPVKSPQHADQEENNAQSAPRDPMAARIAAFQPPPEKNVSAPAEPTATQPHTETSKALEASATQTPSLEPASKPAGPLKELSIQVGQAQQDKVELHVVEHSGELQVAVRAANPDVAQGLRQGLPDLVDRLEQSGFHADSWRPGTSVSAVQGPADTRQRPMQFQQDPSQSQQQSGGQQGRQQNRQNQTYRPQWVRELEGKLSGGKFSGELNGIAS